VVVTLLYTFFSVLYGQMTDLNLKLCKEKSPIPIMPIRAGGTADVILELTIAKYVKFIKSINQ